MTFLGKAPFISPSPMDLLFLPHMFPFDVFSDKMTGLSVKEQKKLMDVARDAWKGAGGPFESNTDLIVLELRVVKKKNRTGPKAGVIIGVPHSLAKIVLAVEEPSQISPKRLKTVMPDGVFRADWEVSTLMQETGDNSVHDSRENKF